MCKLFSRPYPSAVQGTLESFAFNWTTSELTVSVTPSDGDAEIVVSVTEEDEWGWDSAWRLLRVTKDGERIGTARVQHESDLERAQTGVRWWVEKSWVEGSKLVKIRLGTDWEGKAEVVVGMNDAQVLVEGQEFDQHWDLNKDHPFNETMRGFDWRPRM